MASLKVNIQHSFFFFLSLFAFVSCTSSKPVSGSSKSNNNSSKNEIGNFSVVQKRMATKMNVLPSEITHQKLYLFVDKWLSTKYKLGGQSSEGIDCSGFAQILYQEVYSKKLPRTSQDQYKAITQFKRRRNLEEGDLVFFNTVSGKRISHVGVFLINNKFISATNSGVVIADLTIEYWHKRYIDGGMVH